MTDNSIYQSYPNNNDHTSLRRLIEPQTYDRDVFRRLHTRHLYHYGRLKKLYHNITIDTDAYLMHYMIIKKRGIEHAE